MAKNPISKRPKISIFITILMFITIIFAVVFWYLMVLLNNAYSDMNQIEFLSSTTQRLISLSHSEHEKIMQKDVFFIDDSTKNALTKGNVDSLSVLNDDYIFELATKVLDGWLKISEILVEDEINTVDLSLARDSHYKAMTNLTSEIRDYTRDLNERITNYQAFVMLLIFFIAITMLNNSLNSHTELKLNKILAENSQLDAQTGLANRSKCQELFKIGIDAWENKQPALLVLDLNDLKKTNDTKGHRIGDELIGAFASLLETACGVVYDENGVNTNNDIPFIGRYGGDEFIVFYDNIDIEDEITVMADKLTKLTDTYNETQESFQILYALGYAVKTVDTDPETTIRNLFDLADERMYENKIAGKRARNPNYDKEMESGEVLR